VFLCVVLSCVDRGPGAGLIPRPAQRIHKKKNPMPEKGISNNEKEEED
jgi:hypothetical protein